MFPWGVLAGRLGSGQHPPPGGTDQTAQCRIPRSDGLLARCRAATASYRLFPKPKVLRDASGAVLSPPRMIDTTYPAPSLGGLRRHVLVMLPAGYDKHPRPLSRRGPATRLPGHSRRAVLLGLECRVPPLTQASRRSSPSRLMRTVPLRPESWDANVPGQQMGTATSIDLRRWATATFRTNGSWSYAGLSSGGYGAAYLPLIDPDPVHAVCGLSGYYDASRIPISAPLNSAARNQYRPIDHPDQAPPITFLAYGRSDPVTMRQTLAYAAALRKSHHTVVVRTYPGRHSWQVWRPAFADCFRVILPATPSAARPH